MSFPLTRREVAVSAAPWHLGIMCAFDTETTSVDVETARIVTACVAHVDGSGLTPPEPETWLIDPGVEIPEEAVAIHGITTEKARAEGHSSADAVAGITSVLFSTAQEGPLVIYNATYDLTVLDREMRRHGIWYQPAKTPYVIDPFVLDKHLDPYRRGKRTLTATCEHYGLPIDGAHNAAADAIAAARLAWKLAKVYPQIAAMPLDELHRLQVKARADQAASFQDYLHKQGKTEAIDGSWPIKAWAGEAA